MARHWTPASVRAAEERIRGDRANANEIIDLIGLVAAGSDRLRLAALQVCRAVFSEWAASRVLVVCGADAEEEEAEAEAGAATPLVAFRRWVLEQYRRFVALLRQLVQRAGTPVGLRAPALDTLVQLAALEVRHGRTGEDVAFSAFEAPHGAFGQLVGGLALCTRPHSEAHERLREAHLPQLDVSFFMLRALQRLARARQARRPVRPERLLDLLLLVTPPQADVRPEDAPMLVRPAGKPASWGAAAAQLLVSRKHRFEFGRAWRALLAMPLDDATYHRALRELPVACLPHVSRPLQFCDLLSDAYERGGVGALLSLQGLFVLMQKHNLEYPQFYARLYGLLTPEAFGGAHRAEFATQFQTFLSSTGLPVYLIAAFAKRLCRIALRATTPAAALCCALTFNILLRHPAARIILHRPRAGEAGAPPPQEQPALAAEAPADPFVEAEEEPERCRAINSSLWEVDSLRAHYCPTVASLASAFATPMSVATQPMPLEPLLGMSYRSLALLETRKKLRSVPLVATQPNALFGGGGAADAGLAAWY